MSAYLVLPGDVSEDHAMLYGEEHDHLTRANRARKGDAILLTDGKGNLYEGFLENIDARSAKVRITMHIYKEQETPVPVTLAVSLLKGKKMDLVLQKACELGADTILPYTSARSVPVPKENKEDRWRQVLKAATKQSERAWTPHLHPTTSWNKLLNHVKETTCPVLFQERTDSIKWETLLTPTPESVLLTIGPEGGFSEEEIAQAKDAGFHLQGLGPRILRAETAAIAALTILQTRLGGLG